MRIPGLLVPMNLPLNAGHGAQPLKQWAGEAAGTREETAHIAGRAPQTGEKGVSGEEGDAKDHRPVTGLLQAWSRGDEGALEELTPLVYEELRRLARSAFRNERGNHTLQPTAVVHEAFANLIGLEVDWKNRAHFFALSARMMRRILVDHARARQAARRGGDARRTSLTGQPGRDPAHADIMDLDRAMTSLAELDGRKAELIEMQLFAGLSYQEMELATGLSSSTLDRELRMAKAWLRERLGEP